MGRFLKFLTEKTHDYSCLMLDIPNSKFKDILNIIDRDDLHEYGIERDSHITIKYGLHTSSAKDVLDFVEEHDYKKFKVNIHNFSLFENEEYDVLKLEVESDNLKSLNKKICDGFKYTDSYPTYNPHLTLAYLKKGFGKHYIDKLEKEYPDFNKVIESNKLVFSSKNGKKTVKSL